MMLVSALADDDAKRRASLDQPLRCWRARRHVSAYLDGELDPATAGAVESHLASCPTCPPLYAALARRRCTPHLVFREDPAMKTGERVDEILRSLHSEGP